MKVIILTPYFPYPLDSGGNNAQFYMLDQLRHKVDITLACPFATQENFNELKALLPDVDIQVMYIYSDNRSKSYRKYKALRRYIKKTIKNVLSKFKRKPDLETALLTVPVRSKMQFTYLFENFNLKNDFIDFVAQKLNQQKFDIIQVEFTAFLSLGILLPKDIQKIFIHHELGFVRTQREIDTLNKKNNGDSFLSEFLKQHEEFYLKAYDSIITFSDVDKALILSELPEKKVFVSPFAVKSQTTKKVEFNELKNLVYLGGEEHYPNNDAVQWFIADIMPNIVKQFPDLKFKIIGKWNKMTIEKYKEIKSVEFLGYVDDLVEAMKDSVMVVPLRIGSGIRAKIIEAFINEIPVISSAMGIEGIPSVNGKHYFEANSSDDFIRIIQEIKSNKSLVHEIVSNSIKELVPLYDITNCSEIRYKVYQDILKK